MISASLAYASTQRSFRPVPFSGLRPMPSRVSRIVGKANRSCVGRLSFFQITPFMRCLERPRLPCSCRTISLKNARQNFLAGQFLIGYAPSGRGRERTHEAGTICSLAIVVAESLLVQIPEQMKGFDADIGSFQAALEQLQKFSRPFV